MNSSKPFSSSFIAVALAIILALLSAELIVRVAVTSPSIQTFDPELGYRYLPNSWIMLGKEGWAYNKTNELGLIDQAVSPSKQHVVVLGDSIVESKQVHYTDSFAAHIEQTLNEIEIINGGHSSYNPSHYPLVLQRIKQSSKPQLSILFLHPGEMIGLVSGATQLIRDENGTLIDILPKVSSADQIKKKLEPFMQHSALFTHLMRKLKPIANDAISDYRESVRKLKYAFSSENTALTQSAPTLDIASLIVSDGIDRLALILEKIKRESDGQLVVVFYDNIQFLENGKVSLTTDLNEGDAFKGAAQIAQVPVYDLTPTLVQHYQTTKELPLGFHNLIPGDGHLNPIGHKVVADALVPIIQEHLLIQGVAQK
ncbi:hypothetical protein [Marinibactrum halimedae]|uniref:SGNH/GDSL hydrolase family protein n=1 Tax=Marinibactrum halimedae TaxID=1444977 RepID=A0AA37WLE0_9GAMM|nr:hypothetical protein [Marinibactrum halimedae]MCD9458710.1 hypothetical protein [Marinibactrum halimedae]GLS25924.1 hypothetical protein GCM10007877_16390 [Marinibactrum halimedae]